MGDDDEEQEEEEQKSPMKILNTSSGVCLSTGECRCKDGWKGLDCNSPNNTVDSKNTNVDENGKTTIDDNNYEMGKVINDTSNIDKSVQLFNQKLDDNQGELI
ncbi:hypothetical protein ACTFIW_010647 [Dictyostelium discoideum]